MDDINLTCLTEAKNEYSARLVNILTPCVIEGTQSIFQEAWQICHENDELTKYLVTFQNFLVRIPKWNQTIIDEESQRIVNKSKCNYLEDLITCVHICQLKILTSIRVGTKQKKIELDIPRLPDFIHKVYIKVARNLYKNVYLFERGIPALERQKHQRELEIIIKECILNTIRDSIPTDKILRAYIDQTSEIEEEVEEYRIDNENKGDSGAETEASNRKDKKDKPIDISNETQLESSNDLVENKNPEFKKTINVTKEDKQEKLEEKENKDTFKNITHPDLSSNFTEKTIDVSNDKPSGIEHKTEKHTDIKETSENSKNDTLSKPNSEIEIQKEDSISHDNYTQITKPSINKSEPVNNESHKETKEQSLQFNDTDQVLNIDTNRREEVNVPKTIENLEEIGRQREAERNKEDEEDDNDDEERLKILDEAEDVKLDVEDLQEDNKIELDIQEMPTL
jgi:hypothetical protein